MLCNGNVRKRYVFVMLDIQCIYWCFLLFQSPFSSVKTFNAFIGAFCYSKVHFYPSGPFKSIKTMLKSLRVLLGLSAVWNCYPKGGHKKRDYIAFNNRVW